MTYEKSIQKRYFPFLSISITPEFPIFVVYALDYSQALEINVNTKIELLMTSVKFRRVRQLNGQVA